MWVPVAVIDDDRVGRLQVEAQASRPGAQQEHKVLGGRVIEGLQEHAAVLRLGGSCGRRTQRAKSVQGVSLDR